MKRYKVTWEIDIDAESPKEAAQVALDIQRDPGSVALVFDVQEFDQLDTVRVDLESGEEVLL